MWAASAGGSWNCFLWPRSPLWRFISPLTILSHSQSPKRGTWDWNKRIVVFPQTSNQTLKDQLRSGKLLSDRSICTPINLDNLPGMSSSCTCWFNPLTSLSFWNPLYFPNADRITSESESVTLASSLHLREPPHEAPAVCDHRESILSTPTAV